MKIVTVFFLVCLSLLFATGCASYWYQECKTYEECREDIKQCLAELRKYQDLNSSYSNTFYAEDFEKDCMQGKGYRLYSENKLPLRAKRHTLSGALSSTYGIAGRLAEEEQ
ncbi:MAG: hypothetical protein ACYSWP_03250 [Planctomycetota bacterium]|jgi:hypothetical protein